MVADKSVTIKSDIGSPLIDHATRLIERLRVRSPKVHCITNTVAQPITANALLAAGAIPSLTTSEDEIGAFARSANGLLVNLGTLDAERRRAVDVALEVARETKIPWLLDPVFVERSALRLDYARKRSTSRVAWSISGEPISDLIVTDLSATISSSLRRNDPDQVRWVGRTPLSPETGTPMRLTASPSAFGQSRQAVWSTATI